MVKPYGSRFAEVVNKYSAKPIAVPGVPAATCLTLLPSLFSMDRGPDRRVLQPSCEDGFMAKIKVAQPVVELDGDEMTGSCGAS